MFAFAAERDWVETDYTISHYLKNDWALTFVTLKNEHKTAFTLQKSKSIIFCRIEGMTREKVL